jgi:hypothetical protein
MTTQQETQEMFSEAAWSKGWTVAQNLGLAQSFAPLSRPMTRADVEAVVSAVVNHGFEEMYVDQMLADPVMTDAQDGNLDNGMLDNLRQHMTDCLAVQALRERCVMLTLPREVIDHPEQGLTRVRLIVPVRKIGPSTPA